MALDSSDYSKGEAMSRRTRYRLRTVILTPAAALAAWALARLAGVDLAVASGDASVGAADVATAALAAAFAGWVVVRVLERHSRQPQRAWALTGSTALAISIAGPAWLADGASAAALILLHVVTAVVVMTGFARTLPGRGHARSIDRRPSRPSGDPAR
jgi:Family of unknown function (DUF6069)